MKRAMAILLMMAAPFWIMWIVEKVLIIVDGMDGARIINTLLLLVVVASVAKIIRWSMSLDQSSKGEKNT